MPREKKEGQQIGESGDFEKVKKFSELFSLINSQKLGKGYRDVYEEAVGVAKDLVDTKNKSSWDGGQFEENIITQHPDISKDFIAALKRCVENYNPPVNLPDRPLWE